MTTKAETDTHTPPQAVADNARLALEVRAEKPPSQRGMTPVGIARARQLANRQPVSVATLRRMASYFARHEVDKRGATWDEQGPGWQAWMGWGGDEGWAWARRIIESEDTKAFDDPHIMEVGGRLPMDYKVKSSGYAVKFVEDGEAALVRGKGIVFGGADLEDDYFTRETDFGETRPFEGMPVYYDHARRSLKSQIGVVKSWMPGDEGIDVEIELDRSHQYYEMIAELVRTGRMGLSTGSLPQTYARMSDGEIKRWIVGEISLTMTPAEPRTIGVAAKSTEVTSTEDTAPSDAGTVSEPDDTETDHTHTEDDMPHDIDQIIAAAAEQAAEKAYARAQKEIGDHAEGGITAKSASAPAVHVRSEDQKRAERYKAWDAFYRKGEKAAVLEEPQERTLPSGQKALLPTTTPGSYLLEPEWETQIIAKRNQDSLLGVFPITRRTIGTDKYDLRSESTRVTLAPLTPGSEFPDQTPGMTARQVAIYDMAMQVRVNKRVLADTAFDLLGFMNEIIAGAYIDSVNKYLTIGTGSSQPYGVITRGTAFNLAGASAITVGEVKGMYYSIKPQYRRPGEVGWAMNTDTLSAIRSLTVANEFAYAETPGGRQEETMESLLRRPVFESPDMADLGTTNKPVVFGNWRYLYFVENQGISVVRDESNRANYNETVFFVTARYGSDVAQDEAFAVAVNA
jgi:HK97 family phage major capsid protein